MLSCIFLIYSKDHNVFIGNLSSWRKILYLYHQLFAKDFHCPRFGTAVRDNNISENKTEMMIQRVLALPEIFNTLCAILVKLLVFSFYVGFFLK